MASNQGFIDESRNFLTQHYLPRIERCLAQLTDEDIWWRPNEESNSIGNLLLHLSGNMRQWLISGVGGAVDERQRDQEFAERTAIPKAELLNRLQRTVSQADAVLAQLDSASLLERKTIQGREETLLYAIYHVVEHFSMHTGQIILITKLRTGRDLEFYKFTGGAPDFNWFSLE